MKTRERQEILKKATNFFRDTIVTNHIKIGCANASKLSEYQLNPFLIKYLAYFLTGKGDPESIAKALIYPRVLGTSITTSFGTNVQSFISSVLEGFGSGIPGVDIEFTDQKDKKKKYCQLKSGPNTINKDDIRTVSGHFGELKNRAKTNRLNIGLNDMVIGVLYGTNEELNAHYKKLAIDYPIYTGKEFWHRLTGSEDFYADLIEHFGKVAIEVDGRKILNKTILALANDIKKHLKL